MRFSWLATSRRWLPLLFALLLPGCLPREFPAANENARKGSASVSGFARSAPDAIDAGILRDRRFGESPMLAEEFKSGKLPKVADRLPDNPLVVRPINEIGQYGGTLRLDITGEYADISAIRSMMEENLLAYARPVANRIELNMAESYSMSQDGRSAVFKLRRGIKWSDGVPFTVDDILFWYYDCMMNRDANREGVVSLDWIVGGKPLQMEKLDDLTLRIFSEFPMGTLLRRLCSYDFVFAKHYFAPLHPKHNPAATYESFRKASTNLVEVLSPGVPKLGAWMPVQWVRGQQIVFERNPFYWKVDTAGNQLPYIDRVVFTVIADPQVALLKFTNGELDILGRTLEMRAIPTLLAQLKSGRYRLYSRRSEPGPAFYLNWDVADAELRKAFRDHRVRHALSLALNRREISEIAYAGLLEPGGFALAPASVYYSSELFRRNSDFDPGRARALLAEAGYRDRDGDGYLEFSDGRRFSLTIDLTTERDLAELAREYWRAIGIFVHLNPGREQIIYFRRRNGQFEIYLYQTIAAGVEPRNSPFHWSIEGEIYPFWHKNATKEAPDWLREATAVLQEALTTVDNARVKALLLRLQEIYVAHEPAIGTGAFSRPWAANIRLGNVPENGTFAGAFAGWSRGIYQEQMYFRPDPLASDRP